MKKVLIIGGGPAGCAAAHQISMLGGYEFLVVEATNRIGGGCKTMYMGGHPYTFGPRHFLTDKPYLAEFLQKFVPLRSCKEHEFKTYVEQDDEFYNFPITEVDIKRMPDYEKIKELALRQKQIETIEAWQEKKIKDTYVNVNQDYLDCEFASGWIKN